MMGSLEGRIVWVTGSARRVGRVIALECARAGADVVVHCNRSREEGEDVVSAVREFGRRSLLVQGDHGRRAEVERMIAEIEAAFGRLHALVNSAAIFPSKTFEETTDAEFDEAIDANLRGPYLCTQLALPLLRRAASPPAHVINLLDAYLPRPYAKFSAYWCAKGGLDALTRALAAELAPGILVNSVSPGPVLPPEEYSPEKLALSADKTLVKRWGRPEDIARSVLFLLASDYLTGADIVVDGGRCLA